MIKLIRFFRGYARVRVRGGFFARFVDAVRKTNITVFSAVATKNGGEIVIPAGKYKLLRAHAKRFQCRIKVVAKGGIPFWLNKDRYLLTRAVSLSVSVAVYMFLLTRVVGLFFVGETSTDIAKLKQLLRNEGVYIGASQKAISEHFTAERIQLEFQNLSWAAVNLFPGYAVVEMAEKTYFTDTEIPSGKVAISMYDAVITRIELAGGEATADVGDVVTKGDLLATPTVVQSGVSWTNEVKGHVYGLVTFSAGFRVEPFSVTLLRTGNTHTEVSYGPSPSDAVGGCPYELCECSTGSEAVRLFGVELPIIRTTAIHFELREVGCEAGLHNAVSLAGAQIELYESSLPKGTSIVQRRFSAEADGDGYIVIAEYYCETDIAEMIYPER